MTPFEALFLIAYTATCVLYYLWTRKINKKLRSMKMKRLKHKKHKHK